MRIAVTGSTGFIGSALMHKLEQMGHSPVGIVRGSGPGIQWDPAAGTIDKAALEGLDAVVHLAGEGVGNKRWSTAQKDRILRSRVDGTKLLATTLAQLERPPSVLLSASAVGYYGDRGQQELTESDHAGSDFLATVCVEWEASTEAASAAGIAVTHMRTGFVLDRKSGGLNKMLPLFRLGLGGRFGNGEQYMSWISLADEVAAIIWLLENRVHGPVNLTAPEPTTNREFSKTLGQVLHRPSIVPVPKFGPRLVIGRELADALLFTSTRAMPDQLAMSGYQFEHPTLESALTHALKSE
ncbi:MAG: TIGR01777 family oxidoreductase [Acidimicrobiales bacterium]|jgi:uncharacterized protein